MPFTSLLRASCSSEPQKQYRIRLTTRKGLCLCFLIGFCIRIVPEILAFPYPIGFDSVYYAAVIKSSIVWVHWSQFFSTTWLLNAILIFFNQISNLDPFLLLKFVAPLLYGLNVSGIFWFARRILNWNVKLCVLAGALFSVQLASLRISWDLLRNTFGMGLLLFTIPFLGKTRSKRDFLLLFLLSMCVVFAHELAGATFLAIVLGMLSLHLLRKRLVKSDLLTFAAILPALCMFLADVFLRLYPISNSAAMNVISISSTSSARFFFFVNYLSVKDAVFHYPSYLSLILDALSLFVLLYLPYLYLVWKGFFKNIVLNFWTIFLLIGSFDCLLFPFFALDFWDRWMLMLAYPFTFYAVNGISVLHKYNEHCKRTFGISTKKIKGMLLITTLLGCIYLATPVLMNTVNAGIFSLYPTSMHLSFAPTVPYRDVDNVIEAMDWLNANMGGNSSVILHDAFFEWGLIYLEQTHRIIHFSDDVNSAVNVCIQFGSKQVFFLWWNGNVGWYNVQIPSYFVQLRDFERISIYSYSVENVSIV
jgi:hypothetical protein